MKAIKTQRKMTDTLEGLVLHDYKKWITLVNNSEINKLGLVFNVDSDDFNDIKVIEIDYSNLNFAQFLWDKCVNMYESKSKYKRKLDIDALELTNKMANDFCKYVEGKANQSSSTEE